MSDSLRHWEYLMVCCSECLTVWKHLTVHCSECLTVWQSENIWKYLIGCCSRCLTVWLSENFWEFLMIYYSDWLMIWESEKIWRSADLSIWWSDSLKTSDIRYFQTLRSSDVQIVSLSVFLSTSDLCVWCQIFSDVQTFSDLQNFCQVADAGKIL